MSELKTTLRRMLDGDDMDCVRDRTGKSDDYCEGFVDGMNDALSQLTEGVEPLLAEAEITGLEKFVARMFQRANQLVDDGMSTALITCATLTTGRSQRKRRKTILISLPASMLRRWVPRRKLICLKGVRGDQATLPRQEMA